MLPPWVPMRAAQFFFLLIIFQTPLFSFPCRSGVCTNPLEITAGNIVASQLVPDVVVKTILFPGACLNQALNGRQPGDIWRTLLEDYNMTGMGAPPPYVLPRLEVLAGSYFAVAGSVVSLVKPGRMSMFGTLLISWGIVKETLLATDSGKAAREGIHASPMLLLALVLAVLSIKFDAAKVQRLTRPLAKPLKSSAKTKLK